MGQISLVQLGKLEKVLMRGIIRKLIIHWRKKEKMEIQFPRAPHFGGFGDRLVRSYKKAMFAIVDDRTLTDDVLVTTMCLVEQTLKSRPLTSVSDDPDDLEALTLNHFFFVKASLATPFLRDTQCYTDLRRVFKVAQAYAHMI